MNVPDTASSDVRRFMSACSSANYELHRFGSVLFSIWGEYAKGLPQPCPPAQWMSPSAVIGTGRVDIESIFTRPSREMVLEEIAFGLRLYSVSEPTSPWKLQAYAESCTGYDQDGRPLIREFGPYPPRTASTLHMCIERLELCTRDLLCDEELVSYALEPLGLANPFEGVQKALKNGSIQRVVNG